VSASVVNTDDRFETLRFSRQTLIERATPASVTANSESTSSSLARVGLNFWSNLERSGSKGTFS